MVEINWKDLTGAHFYIPKSQYGVVSGPFFMPTPRRGGVE